MIILVSEIKLGLVAHQFWQQHNNNNKEGLELSKELCACASSVCFIIRTEHQFH